MTDRPATNRLPFTLPRLGLGTAPLGGLFEDVSDEEAAATLEAATEGGMSYIDTAPRYGHGLAERRLGRLLPTSAGAAPVISTKTGWLLRPRPDGSPGEVITDWTERGIRESLESSLARLGRSSVDILYLHDAERFPDEIRRTAYPAVRRLREEGLVKAIGFGMNHSAPLASYVAEFEVDVVLVAGRLSLLDHEALTELLPLCARTGTAVVVGGVFNTGLLADPVPGAMFNYQPAPAASLERARQCRALCDAYEVPLPAAAIQFPLLHGAVDSVVLGCRSAAEVTANVAAARFQVPDELWQRLARAGFVPERLLEERVG
ncbi:aldo/keto reductase [Streptomyces sp. NBC_01220]|uniref:aldo/keto reductase n=1 Tax=unclassified Streptomyces TaxID=2593676 RepID=UPI002E2A1A30|nr:MULTISPECIES: aldo/keto reductase [unclassified Streptomyces]WSQ48295.1 aldo/keto reductase [Streptomyces sp. NBC_01220]